MNGNRKFIAAIGAFIVVSAIFAFTDKIGEITYRDIVLGTLGLFITGNVIKGAVVK